MKSQRFSKIIHPEADETWDEEKLYYNVNVDDYWTWIKTLNFEHEIIQLFASEEFWEITLPHMPHSSQELELFKTTFFSEEKEKHRKLGIYGSAKTQQLSFIQSFCHAAQLADQYRLRKLFKNIPNCPATLSKITTETNPNEVRFRLAEIDGLQMDLRTIGQRVSSAISRGDSGFIEAILEFVKSKNIAKQNAKDETGVFSNKQTAWRKFCGFVFRNEALPSVEQGREFLGEYATVFGLENLPSSQEDKT